jgi:hypothetical protein
MRLLQTTAEQFGSLRRSSAGQATPTMRVSGLKTEFDDWLRLSAA